MKIKRSIVLFLIVCVVSVFAACGDETAVIPEPISKTGTEPSTEGEADSPNGEVEPEPSEVTEVPAVEEEPIAEEETEVYLMDACPPYDGNMNTDDFKMAGELYSGFSLHCDAYALVNLKGEYDVVTFIMAPVDGATMENAGDPSVVNVYLDGKKTETYKIYDGDYPKEISIPLNKAKQLKIELKAQYLESAVGFGEIKLQK